MDKFLSIFKRLDAYTFEMIVAVALITLYDFLLSDAMSLPLALQHSTLGQLRALDILVSGAEFVVPVAVFAVLIILWLLGHDDQAHRVIIVYLIWVTIRLTAKIMLVLEILISRPQRVVGVVLRDTVVLLFVNIFLFGVWYWIVDGGGPRVRHKGTVKRFDFAFPQRLAPLTGWTEWQSGFWDYIFLGFAGSTQFSLGDTGVLSVRAKLLFMLQVTLSIIVIVFIASVVTGIIH